MKSIMKRKSDIRTQSINIYSASTRYDDENGILVALVDINNDPILETSKLFYIHSYIFSFSTKIWDYSTSRNHPNKIWKKINFMFKSTM